MPITFVFNSFRSKFLRHFMAERYAKKIDHLRGCNMAFWKDDLIKVNGFNEDLMQWGHEDGEIAFRLHFAGVKKKALKWEEMFTTFTTKRHLKITNNDTLQNLTK